MTVVLNLQSATFVSLTEVNYETENSIIEKNVKIVQRTRIVKSGDFLDRYEIISNARNNYVTGQRTGL